VSDPAPDDALAHGLAGMEGLVLPHVAEIGEDEQDAVPGARERLAGQAQLGQAVVRRVHGGDEDQGVRQGFREADEGFAIGKTMQADLARGSSVAGMFRSPWE